MEDLHVLISAFFIVALEHVEAKGGGRGGGGGGGRGGSRGENLQRRSLLQRFFSNKKWEIFRHN